MSDGELQAAVKLAEAARLISSEPAALQLRLYQTMVEVSTRPNATIVLPVPIELLAGQGETNRGSPRASSRRGSRGPPSPSWRRVKGHGPSAQSRIAGKHRHARPDRQVDRPQVAALAGQMLRCGRFWFFTSPLSNWSRRKLAYSHGRDAIFSLAPVFRTVVRFRWLVVALYALLLGPAVYLAIQVPQDNAPDRLILESDDDYRATRAFEQVFGSAGVRHPVGRADDPFSPEVLRRLLDLEASEASSIASRRTRRWEFSGAPRPALSPRRRPPPLSKFALGSDIFRRQGLVGDHHLSIPVVLANQGANDRRLLLDKVDAVLAPLERIPPAPAAAQVGQSYVHAYLDRDTRETGMRYFPLFFLFVIGLNVALYRSWRALLAFIITLGVSAAMTVGFVGLTGGVFTIVSQVVPMTILITCTATLVYLHSRFVDQPGATSMTTDLRAVQQVPRLHRLDLRCCGRLCRPRGLEDSPGSRDGPVGRRRPVSDLADGVHALPALQKSSRHRRSASVRLALAGISSSFISCRASPIAIAGCWCWVR